jgi:hypothetical protein
MENRSILPVGIVLWFIVSVVFMFLRSSEASIYSSYALMGGVEVVLDVFAFLLCASLWRRATKDGKSIYFWFMVSFVFLAIADATFHLTYGLALLPVMHPLWMEVSLVLFYLAQAIAWLLWLKANNRHGDDVHAIVNMLAFIAGLVVVAMFFFGLHWSLNSTSETGLFVAAETILQVVIFITILLALARMACPFTRMSAMGMLVLMGSDFVINTRYVTSGVGAETVLEITWMLGAWLMVLGFAQQRKALY